MICAKGIISFLSNEIAPISKIFIKNNRVNMRVIEMSKPLSTNDDEQSVVITCSFTAFISEDYECKSLEDYNGKVKPFLQKYINKLIYRVEVHYLKYV